MTVALFKNKYVCPQGRWFKPDKDIIAYCGKIAVPAGAQHVIISGGFVVFVALVAKLGTSSLAAHTIANTAEQAFYIPAYGLQGVAATMVGMAIGEGNEKKADSLVSMFQKSAFIVMGLLGALLFAFSPQLMSIFTPDTEVIKMGSAVLKIVAVAEPFFGLLTVSEGMLRGAGNLKPTVIISLCSMWGVRVFFTWFTLNVLNMDLIAVWVCMTADNLVRSLSYTYLFKTGKWKKTVNFNQKKTETQEIS